MTALQRNVRRPGVYGFRAVRLLGGPLSAMLCVALVVAGRWETVPVSAFAQITVGRLVIVLMALAAAWELWRRQLTLEPLRTPATSLFVAGASGDGVVIVVNVALRGHNTAGALYGYLELMIVAGFALLALASHPEVRVPVLLAAVVGVLLGSVDALLSPAGWHAIEASGGRLSGFYGNPNLLGFTIALVAPILTSFFARPWLRRATVAVAIAILCLAIFATYSRGSILALIVGVIATVALAPRQPRHRVELGAGLVVCAAILVFGGFHVYENLRTHADFGPSSSAGASVTAGGWNNGPWGPVVPGAAVSLNGDAGILRFSGGPGRGVSRPLAGVRAGERNTLVFRVSGDRRTRLRFALEDARTGAASPRAFIRASAIPSSGRVTWTPASTPIQPRIIFWLPRGGAVALSQVRVITAGHRVSHIVAPRLTTSVSTQDNAAETRYEHSREDAAHLALRLFLHHPLDGVGWQQFTVYSARELHFGVLASHDEYLRYAAELGIPGILFLLFMIAGVVLAALRVPCRPWSRAAIGAVLAGAVGLFFANALETPDIALPLIVAAAMLCAGATSDSLAQGQGPKAGDVRID